MVYKTTANNYCLSLVALNSSFSIVETNSTSRFDEESVTEKMRLSAKLCMCVCVCVSVCVYIYIYIYIYKMCIGLHK
jgi:hypothetical protein